VTPSRATETTRCARLLRSTAPSRQRRRSDRESDARHRAPCSRFFLLITDQHGDRHVVIDRDGAQHIQLQLTQRHRRASDFRLRMGCVTLPRLATFCNLADFDRSEIQRFRWRAKIRNQQVLGSSPSRLQISKINNLSPTRASTHAWGAGGECDDRGRAVFQSSAGIGRVRMFPSGFTVHTRSRCST
jgi:hypothetical protein